MRFLIDAQLPPILVQVFRAAGYAAEHVNRIGLGAADDEAIALHARRSGAIIVSKDADFFQLARRDPDLRLIWIKLGNVSAISLEGVLVRALPEIVAALADGEAIIEIR